MHLLLAPLLSLLLANIIRSFFHLFNEKGLKATLIGFFMTSVKLIPAVKSYIDAEKQKVVDKMQSDGKSKRDGWNTELPSTGLGISVLEKMREEKRKDVAWQGKCSGTVYIGGSEFNGHFAVINEACSITRSLLTLRTQNTNPLHSPLSILTVSSPPRRSHRRRSHAGRSQRRSLPTQLTDLLVEISKQMLWTAQFGIHRPKIGPLELKNLYGKTPVLDVGSTVAQIKSGKIKVCRGIKRLAHNVVEFVDGKVETFDAIILATGYKSNVPSWLKGSEMFNEKDGLPKKPFPNGWKGMDLQLTPVKCPLLR